MKWHYVCADLRDDAGQLLGWVMSVECDDGSTVWRAFHTGTGAESPYLPTRLQAFSWVEAQVDNQQALTLEAVGLRFA